MDRRSVRRLREMWAEGFGPSEIAGQLGVTPGTVSKVRRQIGIPARGVPANKKIQDEELRTLWAEGLKTAEIAERFGVTLAAVDKRRVKLGLPPRDRSRGWSAEDDALVRSDLPRRVICARLQVAGFTLTKRRRALGVRKAKVVSEDVVRELWGKEPHKVIADRLGCSPSTVYHKGRRLGLPKRCRQWSADDRRALVAKACADGVTAAARAFGVTESAACVQLWRQGVSLSETREDLTTTATAALLGVHRSTVESWARAGRLTLPATPKRLRALVLAEPRRVNPTKVGENWPDLVALLAGRWG